MANVSPTRQGVDATDATLRERRKTVTFDEEPEVQEFDRESSFDANSLRSADSQASLPRNQESLYLPEDDDDEMLAQDAYWKSQRQQLVVVNSSPSDLASSPEMSDNGRNGRDVDAQSVSSADLSSSGTEASEMGPASPERRALGLTLGDDISFDKTWATAADETAEATGIEKDGSFVSLGGLNRVDSMVDELLQAEILTSPPISAQSTGASDIQTARSPPAAHTGASPLAALGQIRQRQQSPEMEMPVRRGADRTKPAPRLSEHLREASPERQEEEAAIEKQLLGRNTALPTLPNWSPLIFDDKALAPEEEQMVGSSLPSKAQTAENPRRPGGRPHISRDAVLERVAKEKKAQAEAEERQRQQADADRQNADTSLPNAHSTSDVVSKGRPSAPAVRTGTSLTTLSRPAAKPHAEAASYEAKPQPTPSPIERPTVERSSPLDRLGEEMAAAHTPQEITSEEPVPAASPWFNSVSSFMQTQGEEEQSKPEVPVPRRAPAPGHLTLPPADIDAQAPPSPALSTRSGLGPAPPAITPDQHAEQIIARRRSKNKGRRKRSMSTGDAGISDARRALAAAAMQAGTSREADDLRASDVAESQEDEEELSDRASIQADLNKSKLMLDTTVQKALDNGFGNGLCRDISRIFRDGDSPYKVNDRGAFEGVQEKISHSNKAGDVDAGKAWRKLRRPSDINEYADEMRAYRANENPKKAAGKVFVMVDSYHPANMPLPAVPTKFFCILDNGLHVVKTGLSNLSSAANPIAQEFELIQHKNLEFSLTLFTQKEAAPPPSPTKKEKTGSITKSFVSRLLRSPKKEKPISSQQTERLDPLAAYTNREGAFGRVDLVFETVAAQSLGKCFTVDLPVRGVADPVSSISGHSSVSSRRHADFSRNLSRTRGHLRLKLFYLPPMPSVPKKLMPENLKECVLGMDNAQWHLGEPRLSGILTQQGGDCRTWRRRPVKAQGTSLICFNDVTKRPIVKIDLSKAKSIDENWDPYDPSLIKNDKTVEGGKMVSRESMVNKFNADEEPDESYHVPNSFRITFADGEVISFFADTDQERKQWVSAMKEMIDSKRPPIAMWAQVAWDIIRGIEKKHGASPNSQQAPAQQPKSRAPVPQHSAANAKSSQGSGNGLRLPAMVEEEEHSGTFKSSPMKAQLSAASAPTPIRRKQVPSIASLDEDVSKQQQQATSNAPANAPRTPANPAHRTPLQQQSRQASNNTLANPWSTPKQYQHFSVGKPNMPMRPQSDLFTPVRKQSTALPTRQRP